MTALLCEVSNMCLHVQKGQFQVQSVEINTLADGPFSIYFNGWLSYLSRHKEEYHNPVTTQLEG